MPIYFQGAGQMTPAQQMTLRKASGTALASGRKRKSRKKKAAAPRAKKAAKPRAAKKSKRLVKGSAEAKRRMAAIRRSKNPLG